MANSRGTERTTEPLQFALDQSAEIRNRLRVQKSKQLKLEVRESGIAAGGNIGAPEDTPTVSR